jgi:hypothetical protein
MTRKAAKYKMMPEQYMERIDERVRLGSYVVTVVILAGSLIAAMVQYR